MDDDPGFQRLGVRVPALLVSPLVARGSSSTGLLGSDVHFDHASILKTILARFCAAGGKIPAPTARVAAAQHRGPLLGDAGAATRDAVADYGALAGRMVQARQAWAQARFESPIAVARPPGRLTDFQSGYYEMARLLRSAGLPGGHP